MPAPHLLPATTTTLHLDRAITLDPAGNWITVVDPVGTLRTCRIQHAAGPVDTLTLLDALPIAPDSDNPIDWRWLSDYQATPGKRVSAAVSRDRRAAAKAAPLKLLRMPMATLGAAEMMESSRLVKACTSLSFMTWFPFCR